MIAAKFKDRRNSFLFSKAGFRKAFLLKYYLGNCLRVLYINQGLMIHHDKRVFLTQFEVLRIPVFFFGNLNSLGTAKS